MTREEAIKVLEMFLYKQCDLERTKFAYDELTVWDAVNMASEALKQPEQQWIPVSERLPELDEDVWVTDDAGGMATVNTDSCGRYEDTGEKFWYTSQNVTAWMPMIIPEPYKGDDAV